MKTLSKVLSMLIVVVMCLSLFGASAYATGVPTVVGADSAQTQTPNVPTVSLFNAGDDGLEMFDGSQEIGQNGKVDVTKPGVPSVNPNPNPTADPSTTTDPSTTGNPTDGTKPKVEDADKNENEDPMLRTTPDGVWMLENGDAYVSLTEAVRMANGGKVTLTKSVELFANCEINGNAKIDLGEKTLTLGSNTLKVTGGTITLSNGTISHTGTIAEVTGGTLIINGGTYGDPSFSGNVIIKSGDFTAAPNKNFIDGNSSVNGTNVVANAEKIASISGRGSWGSVAEAYNNAISGDTIVIRSNAVKEIPASNLTIEKDLVFRFDNETVDFSGVNINNANVTFSGYEAKGTVTLNNSTLNLNTQKAGTITANGKAVSVNGGTVESIVLNGATLNMGSGTITSLTTNGNDVLNVSGGNVKAFVKGPNATANRAITGGVWELTDAAHFKNCLANGATWNANGNTYTVNGSGSTTNPGQGGGTTTPSQGGYALSTNAYTKGSNSSVYIARGVNAPTITSVWYGTSSTQPTAKLGSYNSGSYTYINNSSLDSLPNGTYYIFAAYNGDASASPAGTLTIYGQGTQIPSYGGTLQVGTRYENDWYQGENALQFYVTPFPGSGKDWTNMRVSIDGREVGNLDYYDYHNGYFYISTSKLESLGSGTHWLTVENITTGETGSCSFYIGATLKARDTNKHVTGSSKDLKFVCSEPISRVWVGDKELDNYDSYDYYTLSRDGKTLTLTARFLNNRTAGNTYNLTVETVTGERVSTTFQILTTAQASSSPKTGDNSNLALWISALVMSGAAAAVIIPSMKRKEIEG